MIYNDKRAGVSVTAYTTEKAALDSVHQFLHELPGERAWEEWVEAPATFAFLAYYHGTESNVRVVKGEIQAATAETDMLAQVMSASHSMTTSMMQAVIDGLERDYARADAELEIIRHEIVKLCNQQWAPHPGHVLSALWPDPDDIDQGMRARLGSKKSAS